MSDNMILINKRISKLSFAVSLQDDYLKAGPIGKIKLSLKETDKSPVLNPSLYYVFLNLPKGTYTILTTSEYYFDESTSVTVEDNPLKNPIKIILKPRPSYPFPEGETLVRGILRDKDGCLASFAKLSYKAANKEFMTFSTDRGEFVLYFGALMKNDTIKESGKHFVKGDGGKRISIRTEIAGLIKDFEISQIEVGNKAFIDNFIIGN